MIQQEELQVLINKGLSQREIAEVVGSSHTAIRYALSKYGLKTLKLKCVKSQSDDKICSSCKLVLPKTEYYSNGEDRLQGYCKSCTNKLTVAKQQAMKLRMVEYKGSKCEGCDLTLSQTHYSVFEFHHVDPVSKDINFSTIRNWSWDRVKTEIDKCKLLCANCHRLVHAKILQIV